MLAESQCDQNAVIEGYPGGDEVREVGLWPLGRSICVILISLVGLGSFRERSSMVSLTTHRSYLTPLFPWSLFPGHTGLALPEICQALFCLWVFTFLIWSTQKKKTKIKTTIPPHNDVAPSFILLFESLLKAISLDILFKNASPPTPTIMSPLQSPGSLYVFLLLYFSSEHLLLPDIIYFLFIFCQLHYNVNATHGHRVCLFCTSLLHTQCLENCLGHSG